MHLYRPWIVGLEFDWWYGFDLLYIWMHMFRICTSSCPYVCLCLLIVA